MPPSTRIPLLFGTMTFGQEGKYGARTHQLSECQEILDVFFSHGHHELDTARMYGAGTTEQYLAQLDLKNATIDTKVWPDEPGVHKPENLRARFLKSLEVLKRDKVRVFYLHAPDRSVPFEHTVREVNNLYQEGRFEIFGLSNYTSWEVAEIVGICQRNNWIMPKIYQAMYNAITRGIEPELIPCLRKFGLRLVIYNPLAGGLFAGKIAALSEEGPSGGRFDPNTSIGKIYRARYMNEGAIKALDIIKRAAAKHNLRLTELGLRWCVHHSQLTPEDGIILGASSAAQLKQNCEDCEKGPLPQDVVAALDEAARVFVAHGNAPTYWR